MTISLAELVVPGWAARQAEQNNADLIDRIAAAYRLPLLLAAAAIAPAVEEFAFRGLLLKKWAATRGLWTGILGSAAVFAILHPPTWVGAFVFGVVAGVLYLWSGSLLAPILLHVLNNSLVALALAVGDRSTVPRDESPFLDSPAEWTVIGFMVLLLGAAIVAVVRPLVRQIHARPATDTASSSSIAY
jgi:membrane protease YdiL (CAAX protease family)